MISKFSALVHFMFCLCILTVTGCAVALIGIGAGVGTLAYVNGKLKKTYNAEYHAAIRASEDTLRALKIPAGEKLSDELKTIIRAKRPDGTPVTVEVVRIRHNLTEVAVRTGTVGVWDRNVSAQIQEYIGKKIVQQPNYKVAGQTEDVYRQKSETSHDESREKNDSERQVAEAAVAVQNNGRRSSVAVVPALDSDFVIFFDKDSNELSQKATEKLARIADIASKNREALITLHGYTDAVGAASYNLMVSESRAITVKIYLLGKGVEAARIKTIGHGVDKTMGVDDSEYARRLRRRVEIEIANAEKRKD
jgi:outer membrane protein OmpA-like peptidoglycan-associated protein